VNAFIRKCVNFTRTPGAPTVHTPLGTKYPCTLLRGALCMRPANMMRCPLWLSLSKQRTFPLERAVSAEPCTSLRGPS
jgi:hypothetical protein